MNRADSRIEEENPGWPRRGALPAAIEGTEHEFHAPLGRREALRQTLRALLTMAVELWLYYRGMRPLMVMAVNVEGKQG